MPDPSAGSIQKCDSGKAKIAFAGFEKPCSSPSQNAEGSARQVGNGSVLDVPELRLI